MGITAFNRAYELIIGVPPKILPVFINESVESIGTNLGVVDIFPGTVSKTGVKITDLEIAFTAKKTADESPNTLNLKVFNLSKTRAKKLENYESETYVVSLRVGYGTDLKTLYYGEVQSMWTETDGADQVTNIECGTQTIEGKKPLLKAYDRGVNEDVIKEIAGFFNVAVIDDLPAPLKLDLASSSFSNGFCATSTPEEELTKILDQFGYTYTVDNNVLSFVPHNKSKLVFDRSKAVLLTPKTGLIQSPVRSLEKVKEGTSKAISFNTKTASSGKDLFFRRGLKFKSLLNPRIVPGKIIKLESEFFDTFCVAETCNYSGETRGDSWDIDVEAVEVHERAVEVTEVLLGG